MYNGKMDRYYTIRDKVLDFALDNYGTEPEYLWAKTPDTCVLRNNKGKWYAIIMDLPRSTFDLGEGYLDIINVKIDSNQRDAMLMQEGFYPAYHMNKKHWISILLDGTVDINLINDLIDKSYDLTS